MEINVGILEDLLNETEGRKGVVFGARARLEAACREWGMVREDTEIGNHTQIDSNA